MWSQVIGRVGMLHSALGCYELQHPSDSRVDVEDAVRFVEEAESAWRVDNHDRALPAAATAANLARRPFLPAERGLWIERRRDDLRATLRRALDVLVEGWPVAPSSTTHSATPMKPSRWTRTGKPVTSG